MLPKASVRETRGRVRSALFASALLLCCTTAAVPQTPTGTTWLDRPLASWNLDGRFPAVASPNERRDQILARCQVPASRTDGHRALEGLGWIAYDHLDRSLSQGDVEIVAGMMDADDMCRPVGFQLFVFVAGRLAGTLSPDVMTTGQDASAGAVRIVNPDTISAEFARYGNKDAPCCPTARVSVRYRIDRSGSQPMLTPLEVRTTRSQ